MRMTLRGIHTRSRERDGERDKKLLRRLQMHARARAHTHTHTHTYTDTHKHKHRRSDGAHEITHVPGAKGSWRAIVIPCLDLAQLQPCWRRGRDNYARSRSLNRRRADSRCPFPGCTGAGACRRCYAAARRERGVGSPSLPVRRFVQARGKTWALGDDTKQRAHAVSVLADEPPGRRRRGGGP